MNLKINEIFYSLQGESLYAGLACLFIRLTGCNLRCAYCDTQYAYDEGTDMAVADIINRVAACGCPLVEITGGEPLLQEHTPALVRELISRGYQVLLETNGTCDIRGLPKACIKIVDIKCPGSGESGKHCRDMADQLQAQDQVKFVIADETDYRFALNFTRGIRAVPAGNILFSPADDLLAPAVLAEWILKDRLGVRLHLRQHRIIWQGERGR